jgi:hypothetical protein
MEELCILFPFPNYSMLSRQLQGKLTLWVVPYGSEERPTLMLHCDQKDVTSFRVFC